MPDLLSSHVQFQKLSRVYSQGGNDYVNLSVQVLNCLGEVSGRRVGLQALHDQRPVAVKHGDDGGHVCLEDSNAVDYDVFVNVFVSLQHAHSVRAQQLRGLGTLLAQMLPSTGSGRSR